MRVKAVVGAGYGDEGKGSQVDYFCRAKEENGRVLNVRSNGGTQAGHTVCAYDDKYMRYNMWVFRNLGSGSLAGADTFLASRFLVNAYELSDEILKFKKHFGFAPVVFISDRCRLQFKMDEALNRVIENTRTNTHGTCGLGIFETVNRHHMGFELRMQQVYDFYKQNKKEELQQLIQQLSLEYACKRVEQIRETEKIQVDLSLLVSNLEDFAFHNVEDVWRLFSENEKNLRVTSLNDLMKCGEYTDLVFECSQGLELNWGDARNTPHVTASHTGLTNVIKELKTCEAIDMITDFEACYVTRSYKTKHGDGTFYERDLDIEADYNLYDRTNVHNRFQGELRYGRIDKKRMVQLINDDFKQLVEAKVLGDTCRLTKSLSVTHLDQTNEAVLLVDEEVFFKEFNAKDIIKGDKTYYSFGEKASDIVEYTV